MRITVVIVGVCLGWTLWGQATTALRGEAGVAGAPGPDGATGEDGAPAAAPFTPTGPLHAEGPLSARQLTLDPDVTIAEIDAANAFVSAPLFTTQYVGTVAPGTALPAPDFAACSAATTLAVGCVGHSPAAGIFHLFDGCGALEETIAAGTYYFDVRTQAACLRKQ